MQEASLPALDCEETVRLDALEEPECLDATDPAAEGALPDFLVCGVAGVPLG